MRSLTFILLLALVLTPVAADDESVPVDAAAAVLDRDLTAFPCGKYVMVQAYDQRRRDTVEAPSLEEKKEQKSRIWNRFTFDLDVVEARNGDTVQKEAHVTVRRIQIGIEGKKDHLFDSDGDSGEQSELLERQFRCFVGGKASVDLASFGKGTGFAGFSEIWDKFAEENPTFSRAAAANRKNYGDTRLDRIFTQGLPILFGSDAGRAHGETRKLTVGESFDVEIEIPAIAFEPELVKHTAKVREVKDGSAVLIVTWALNGFRNKEKDGRMVMCGGDIEGSSEMTIHLASGLLTGLKEQVRQTDQSCGFDMVQRTCHLNTTKEFSILPR